MSCVTFANEPTHVAGLRGASPLLAKPLQTQTHGAPSAQRRVLGEMQRPRAREVRVDEAWACTSTGGPAPEPGRASCGWIASRQSDRCGGRYGRNRRARGCAEDDARAGPAWIAIARVVGLDTDLFAHVGRNYSLPATSACRPPASRSRAAGRGQLRFTGQRSGALDISSRCQRWL